MARPIIIDIAHELGRAEAHRRIQNGFGRIRDQLGVGMMSFDERWEGDRLHFSARALGGSLAGRLEIFERSVRIELDLPWALAALAETVRKRVGAAGTLLLEKK
jgi:hypothetical protein